MGVFKPFRSISKFDKKSKISGPMIGLSSSTFTTEEVSNLMDSNFKNPNPDNYEILKSEKIGNYLIIFINYPDCDNYEGNKILVFENANIKDLLKQETIDPHFSDNMKYYSPIARFEPTNRGWDFARIFVERIKNVKI